MKAASLGALLAIFAVGAAPPPKRITVDFRDADVHDVLRLLAEVGQVNMVVPDHVSGRVTLRLRDVPWPEALEVVLRAKGLGQERVGEVIQVDLAERLAKRGEDAARLRETRTQAAPLETRIFTLSHARASDLAPIVRAVLSARGTVVADARTNTLVVTDVADGIARVRPVLAPKP